MGENIHLKTPDRLNWIFSITLERRLIQSVERSSGSTPLYSSRTSFFVSHASNFASSVMPIPSTNHWSRLSSRRVAALEWTFHFRDNLKKNFLFFFVKIRQNYRPVKNLIYTFYLYQSISPHGFSFIDIRIGIKVGPFQTDLQCAILHPRLKFLT